MPLSYANIASKTAVPEPAPATPAPATPASATPATPAPASGKDTMGLLPSEPSICIARAPTSFSDGVIMGICQDELSLGKVEKVDIIQKVDKNGHDFVTAFVHFKEWSCQDEGASVRSDLMNGEKIKIVYEDPRYITLTKSYTTRPDNSGKHGKRERDGNRQHNGKHGKRERDGNRQYNGKRTQHSKHTKPRVVIDEDGWATTTSTRKVHSTTTTEPSTPWENPEMKRTAVNGFANLAVHSDDE